eukprot:2044076-Prymnesium_polylepis.2
MDGTPRTPSSSVVRRLLGSREPPDPRSRERSQHDIPSPLSDSSPAGELGGRRMMLRGRGVRPRYMFRV